MAHPGDLVTTLNSFGSPDDIAEYLRGFGVKGEVEDAESCVISNWIMGNVDCVGVSTSDTINVFYDDWIDAGALEFQMSPCVKQFIDLFDKGYYPDLVSEEPEWNSCTCPGCNMEYDPEF